MEIFAKSSESWRFRLSRFGNNRVLAVSATDSLLHVVIVLTVNVHLVISDEWFVSHLLVALDASEAGRVKATSCDPDDLEPADLLATSWTELTVGLVMFLTEDFVTNVEECTDDLLLANTAFLCSILKMFFKSHS